MMAAAIASCAASFPQRAYPPPEEPIPGLLPPIPTPDPEKLQNVAYHHYGRGDYIRALGFAYDALKAAPANPRYPILLGLIYDQGLDRPDLAVIEYRKLLGMEPSGRLAESLEQRVQHLRRLAYQRQARQRVFETVASDGARMDLAVFPLEPVGSVAPPPGLTIALVDMVLQDLAGPGAGIDPLQLHIYHNEFARHRPDAGPSDFARWIRASKTLTGRLMDLGDHRVRITLQVFGRDGGLLWEGPPVTANLGDLQTLRNALSGQAAKGLNLPLPADYPPRPFKNPVNLLVHARALSDYVGGDVPTALRALESLRRFEPRSTILDRTLTWARRDMAGANRLPDLLKAYRSLGNRPDPLDAVHRRLMATHALTTPTPASQTGSETTNPYKPPVSPEALP